MAAGTGPHEAPHDRPPEAGGFASAPSGPALAGGHAGHLPARGRALAVSAWLTGIYFLIELAVGLWTGSVAVISDTFHTFPAVGGVLIALLAARIARRPADHERSFGWRRAQLIGAPGKIPGIGNVHHVHAWALTSGHHLFAAHLRPAPGHAGEAPAILRTAHDILRRRFGFRLVTLQIETGCLDESGAEDIGYHPSPHPDLTPWKTGAHP